MTINPPVDQPPIVFTMRGVPLQSVKTFKYLGVHFQQDCSWTEHLQYVRSRMNKALGLWRPVLQCHHLPASVRIGLAYTFVYTPALYGAEAWIAPKNELDKIDAICKVALRLIFGMHQYDCHAEVLFADCGLLPVSVLISAAKLCWKSRMSTMSADRFPVAVESISVPGGETVGCTKGGDFDACINAICQDIHKFYG